jgi:hypothetical protein
MGISSSGKAMRLMEIHTQCAHAIGMAKLSLEINLALKSFQKRTTSFHNYPFLQFCVSHSPKKTMRHFCTVLFAVAVSLTNYYFVKFQHF